MVNASPEASPKIPAFAERKDLQKYLSDEFGDDVMAQLETAKDNTAKRRVLIEALRKNYPQLNGQADKAAEKLLINEQEIERKEGWMKSVLLAPFRGLKWVFKKTFVEHPYLSTAAVVALLWYTGWGAQAGKYLLKYLTGSADQQTGEIIREVLPGVAPRNPLPLPPGVTPEDIPISPADLLPPG